MSEIQVANIWFNAGKSDGIVGGAVANTFSLRTDGVDRLIINSTAVSYNTTASFANLSVTSQFNVSNSSVNTFISSNSTGSIIGSQTSGQPLFLFSNNTLNGIIAANGNFGVGNNSPSQKLVVEGNMYANGVPLQMTYLRYDTKSTYSFATAGQTGAIITDLNASITPRRSTSRILVTYCITYEVIHTSIFKLFRNTNGANTQIGNNATDSNYWSGLWVPGYDVDNNSTPRTSTLMFLDSPASTNTCTYQLMIQSAGSGATTFYLNRSVGSAGQASYNVGISQVFLQEIGTI